jgi:dolichol-phosphate mannosyltransferase
MRGTRQRWLRFSRFNMVGLLGAALQLLLLALLTKYFRVSLIAATPLAVEIVVLHNFVWHERFTWRDRRFKSTRQRALGLWRFHAGNGLTSLFGNMVLIYCFVERLNFPVLPSAVGAIILCSLVNFVLADRWAYATGRGCGTAVPES